MRVVFVIIGLKLRNHGTLSTKIRRDVVELPFLDILNMDSDLGTRKDRKLMRLLEESILPLDESDATIPVVIDELENVSAILG